MPPYRTKERIAASLCSCVCLLQFLTFSKDTDDECPRISQISGAGIFASSNCLPIPRRKACGPFIFRSFPNAMCAYFAITVHILPIFV